MNWKGASKLLGIGFTLIGIGFFSWSTYLLFFLPPSEDLVRIIPQEDFKFFLSDTTEKHSFVSSLTLESLPKQSILLGYSFEESTIDLISVGKKSSSQPLIQSSNTACAEYSRYVFCVPENRSFVLYELLENMKAEKPSVSSLRLFHVPQPHNILEDDGVLFLGETESLGEIVNTVFPEQALWNAEWSQLLTLSSSALPYFSGNIDTNTSTYSLVFHKSTSDTIFPQSLSSHSFVSDSLSVQKSALFLQSPQSLFDFLESSSALQLFPLVTEEYQSLSGFLELFFEEKVDFEKDIKPLLLGDIFATWEGEKWSMYSALPNTSIANTYFEKFSTVFSEIAKEIVPEKKGFLLQDGSMIYEMVPSDKNVESESDTSENAAFAIFKTFMNNNEVVQSVAYKNSLLLFSNTDDAAKNLFNGNNETEDASKNTELFVSARIFGADISFPKTKMISSVLFNGREEISSIVFDMKVEWGDAEVYNDDDSFEE